MVSLLRLAVAALVVGQFVIILLLAWHPSGDVAMSGSNARVGSGAVPRFRARKASEPVQGGPTLPKVKIRGTQGAPGFDPMPNVHMVYMYANGSDPAIIKSKSKYGGPSGV